MGHTWVRLSDGDKVEIEGGHSGETGKGGPGLEYHLYENGIGKLNQLGPSAESPYPELKTATGDLVADPRNPIAWLHHVYDDGHWEEEGGGHTRVTHEASWELTRAEFNKVKGYLEQLRDNPKKLRRYGLTQKQCTSTAADVLAQAGIRIDPVVTIEGIPKSIPHPAFPTERLRLWADQKWSTIRIALPEEMARQIQYVNAGKNHYFNRAV